MDYILPRAYTMTLAAMLDDAPQSDYLSVSETIQQELGGKPEELFSSFEKEPIASASLAQVHVAYERETGRKLAVKVQHQGLAETSQGDIDAVSFVTHAVAYLFPEADFRWLADEVAPNLPLELDFRNEARNAERCARNFACVDDVVVPDIAWTLTEKRVLTMSFEDGQNVTDIKYLEKHGLSNAGVSSLLSRVFCKQIFLDGFVHCDPHPANVLIRPHDDNSGRPQLVLLDHGLYRELDDEFRQRYSRLWYAIVMADVPVIRER